MKRPETSIPAVSLLLSMVALLVLSCAAPEQEPEVVVRLPVETLEAVTDTNLVVLDTEITSDGGGSFRVTVEQPVTVRLYDLTGIDVEGADLVYRAQVRTDNIEGHVYLEMICRFPNGAGDFSRAVRNPLYGTTDWTIQETAYTLADGQSPENVELNLAVNGTGTAWIDDISIWRVPTED